MLCILPPKNPTCFGTNQVVAGCDKNVTGPRQTCLTASEHKSNVWHDSHVTASN